MRNPLVGLLILIFLGMPALFAQSQDPFCQNAVESFDCSIPGRCVGQYLPCEVEKRYSYQTVPWDLGYDFSTLAEGASSCDPTYFFDIKKSDGDWVSMVNSERSRWNHADDKAFFQSKRSSNGKRHIAFYDGSGTKQTNTAGTAPYYHLFSKSDFFIGANAATLASLPQTWTRFISEIRWHPTEGKIIYARQLYAADGQTITGGQLVQRSVTFGSQPALGSVDTLFTFTGYTISGPDGNYEWAGGDGNDVDAGRILLSLVDINNPTANDQYVVYDFANDGLVKPNINPATQSYSETYHNEATFTQALFSLYADDQYFDYATISASGLFVVARYSKKDSLDVDNGTMGISLFDLSGNVIQRSVPAFGLVDRLFQNGDGHLEVGFFRTDVNEIKECVVVKVTQGAIANDGDSLTNDYLNGSNDTLVTPVSSISAKAGDIIAIHWEVEVVGGQLRHKAEANKVLDWGPSGNAGVSGDQYSLSSIIQTPQASIFDPITGVDGVYPFRGLLSFKPVDHSPPGPMQPPLTGKPYYGEIVEYSLDASDPVPRRIVHHRITDDEFLRQPEAWLSRRADKLFFKSSYQLGNADHLYFIELPARTCIGLRQPGQLRQAEPEIQLSHTFFPNPLHPGKSFTLILDEETLHPSTGVIQLTSLDGKQQVIWEGEVKSGQAIRGQLPELPAGVYLMELRNQKDGTRLWQEKVLVK